MQGQIACPFFSKAVRSPLQQMEMGSRNTCSISSIITPCFRDVCIYASLEKSPASVIMPSIPFAGLFP